MYWKLSGKNYKEGVCVRTDFDNFHRDMQSNEEDFQAYNVTSFLPEADHGSVFHGYHADVLSFPAR